MNGHAALPARQARRAMRAPGLGSLARTLALVVLGVLGMLDACGAAGQAGTRLWALPHVFVDERGQGVALATLAGQPAIVSMEYTECRFVCSINWRKLVEIQAEADRQQRPVRIVVISLDPAHDTPALWREYRSARGLVRDNWRFLTGNRAATDAAVAALGVHWWLFDGAIMHDLRIVRLDAQGRIVRTMESFDLTAAEFLRD